MNLILIFYLVYVKSSLVYAFGAGQILTNSITCMWICFEMLPTVRKENMTSKTKQHISKNIISEIFNKHSLGNVINTTVLTGGKFNTVLKIQTEDQNQYVIKIAPDSSTEVLTYEQQLIKSEVYIYKLLSNVKKVHFPKIFGYNWDDSFKYKYLIMEFIEGDMLSDVKLSQMDYDKVTFDLGCAMAEIHTIHNDSGFGYIQNGLKETWKDAYYNMIENVINDGINKNAKIPYLEKIKKTVEENEFVLDFVKVPSLVHFDLWTGNIIVKNCKLYALIDCERAMFGDIMGEFISLDYLSTFDLENNKQLIRGYNSIAEQKINFDKYDLIRLYLMKLYLGLIAYVEPYYRLSKITPEFYGTRNYAKKMLNNALVEIEKLNEKG